jgi:hypothetical protein
MNVIFSNSIYILVQMQIHSEVKHLYLSLYISTDKRVTKKRNQTYAPLHSIFFFFDSWNQKYIQQILFE